MSSRLSLVIPCFNEEAVLPETAKRLGALLTEMTVAGQVSGESAIYFIDDGSHDRTWPLIEELNKVDPRFRGIKLSRNHGHQRALLAGLMTAPGDVLISVDADLQDDLGAIPAMLRAHAEGAEIVYGVRAGRGSDSFFKRVTAEGYYRMLAMLGVDTVFNHADYRLMSRRVIEVLREHQEVNLYLRGLVRQLGFKTASVTYDRRTRFAGESKYPLAKMLAFALEGVTSLTTRPIRFITLLGFFVSLIAFITGLWALGIVVVGGFYVPGWASLVVAMTFLGGLQILSLGIIGEYVGKIYMETKRRPRFIIEKTL